MKTSATILLSGLLFASLVSAQPGPGGGMGGPTGPGLNASLAKLFGENSAFSAALEIQSKGPDGQAITVPGKLSFDHGKSRFEMDMSEMKGGGIPPGMVNQMKTMGMDKMVMIARPDKKSTFMIYPGLGAYVENPLDPKEAASTPEDFKVETTELGKETIDGHPCIKNKAVVTGKDGEKHESTVWNATDLKKFPIKIEVSEQGNSATLNYRNVNLTKPEASHFDLPPSLTKYGNFMEMMQQAAMKRVGGAATPKEQ